MRTRNIKSVCRRKVDHWLASIDDEKLRNDLKPCVIVSGGAIASMLLGEKVNDFDLYLKTPEACLAVAEYYVKKFKNNPPTRLVQSGGAVDISAVRNGDHVTIVVQSAGIAGESGNDNYQYFEQTDNEAATGDFVDSVVADAKETADADAGKPLYRPKFLSSNAITLSHRVQIVIRFTGTVEQIHANYDFIHCCCAWESSNGKLTIPPKAMESLLARHLRYNTSKYPLCAIIRTRKFIARGWTIDAGQYVKMAFDLNKLDLSIPSVLEDQMIGVDAAYFYEVLTLLREHDGDKVDATYLMQVIDRVFG